MSDTHNTLKELLKVVLEMKVKVDDIHNLLFVGEKKIASEHRKAQLRAEILIDAKRSSKSS